MASPRQHQGGGGGGDTTAIGGSQDAPVVLDDDDGGGGGGDHDNGSLVPPDWRVFYGQQGAAPADAQGMVRYQDQQLMNRNVYPSRRNGLGFDMARLRRDTGWVDGVDDVQPAWDHSMFMSEAPLGFDMAVSSNWGDRGERALLRGFPMVSNVVFYRPHNHGGARSACFFKALSYIVYGRQSLYNRVQAEHWQHYSDILDWDDHPRHQLYERMNQKFFDTIISAGDVEVATVANFFQLLSIPNIWLPLDMLDVTADLYNLFIVVYTITESGPGQGLPQVREVSTKGSYNARHVFLLFNGFHYQPMVPNEFLASEFTFPRVTFENTNGLPSSSDRDRGKSSTDLQWRNTWGQGLDRSRGSFPVDHVFYHESLRITMKGVLP
ncbi:hypothetical protein diail_11429 [Diaporthe ilicicola]|nr:hypothetical protein diail_11429 [Diaporthe ilicicola]